MAAKLALREVLKAFVPPGILWLKKKCVKKIKKMSGQKIIKKTCEKYRHPIYIRNGTSDERLYKKIIVQKEYEFKTQASPNCIIDAGANIGLTTVYFANKYPNTTIIAIEPEKSNYEMLIKNTKNYPNVAAIKAALFNKVGEIDLLDVGRDKWGVMTEANNNYQSIKANSIIKIGTVDSITINKILEDYGLTEIDILKIDIEGSEKEVFSSSFEWIAKTKSIIAELHERMKVGCNRSFYCNTNGFDDEWQKGENIYLTRDNYIYK